MDDDIEDALAALVNVSLEPRLLVAAGFDGALAEPGLDRAEQPSSEALNVLLALPGTTVAVVSPRPAEEVGELMFLSGSKGGLRVVAPDDLGSLREETGAACVVVDADPASLADLGSSDVGVLVGENDPPPGMYRVADVDAVVEILEELARLRRRPGSVGD